MSNLNEEDIAIITGQKEKNDFEISVIDNLSEWSSLITELCLIEIDYLKIKDNIFDKEQWIIDNTNFKEVYGKNNADVRKQHLRQHMKSEYATRKHLEVRIDYLKRRISFLKQLIYTKTVMMEVKQ